MRRTALPQQQQLLLLLAALLLLGQGAQSKASTDSLHPPVDEDNPVVELTDYNFDSNVKTGTIWMVEIYAQWCSHCRQLEPQWKLLASELLPKGVKTGKIDGPKNKLLMARFSVGSFPAIYLLKDGSAWEYEGQRTVPAMQAFAESGYEKINALPFWRAPNSLLGKFVGHWHRIPGLINEAYTYLHEDKGFSELTIVAACLAVPVVVGAASICLVDGMCVRQARLAATLGHAHAE